MKAVIAAMVLGVFALGIVACSKPQQPKVEFPLAQ